MVKAPQESQEAATLAVGDRVLLSRTQAPAQCAVACLVMTSQKWPSLKPSLGKLSKEGGTVRFLGKTKGQDGEWVGVELDNPMRQLGKFDGSIGGVQYFDCKPKHGTFARRSAISRCEAADQSLPAIERVDSAAKLASLLPPKDTTPTAAVVTVTPPPSKAPPTGEDVRADCGAGVNNEARPSAPASKTKGKGKGPAPPPKSLAALPKMKTQAFAEGDTVEVLGGPHMGKHVVVRKVVGDGKETRFRVELQNGSLSWVDAVGPASGPPPVPEVTSPVVAAAMSPKSPPEPQEAKAKAAKAAPPGQSPKGKGKGPPPPPKSSELAMPKAKKAPLYDEGSLVEVTAGPHAGKHGVVRKVTGDGKETRWRVEIEGGPTTWVDSVTAAGKPAGDGNEAMTSSPPAKATVAAAEPRVLEAREVPSSGSKGKGRGKGPPPPSKSAAPPTKKPPAHDEGAEVVVTDGVHAGKRGIVRKVTGDGKDTRWRVELEDGPTTWVDSVVAPAENTNTDVPEIRLARVASPQTLPQGGSSKGKSKGPPPPPKHSVAPPKTKPAPEFGEGTAVQVTLGAHAGKTGIVRRVAGEGKETRWRVELHDGPTTWVDAVGPAPSPEVDTVAAEKKGAALPGAVETPLAALVARPASAGKGKSKGPTPPPKNSAAAAKAKPKPAPAFGEGSAIEVAAGPHAGKQGIVRKVTGEGKETRWRVQIENGPTTWVDSVTAISS